MDETRVFKTYSYSDVLNGADPLPVYDFAGAGYYEDIQDNYFPRPVSEPRVREQWVREKAAERSSARVLPRKGIGLFLVTAAGALAAAVLLVMLLLAQIQMTALSDSAAGLENRILELRAEQNRLAAAYETAFSLAEVEEYALNELGMQKPRPEQIVYLSGVGAADRAVIVEEPVQNMFSLGVTSVMDSLWSYFGAGA